MKTIKILRAAPRGFCAGVVRAIEIVEKTIEKYGSPVYVRHEIVHNRYVVEDLRAKGAIFINELDEIVDKSRPVIFSAHGVPKSVPETAKKMNLLFFDATCPLVSKVHIEAKKHYDNNLEILLIGHDKHPEVIGTMGQLPNNNVALIETTKDAKEFIPKTSKKLAYITQTTLSVDDTYEIVKILKERFPDIIGPHKNDICYATTNRQEAVKKIAKKCDIFIVVGAPTSSNSMRLVEVAKRSGCSNSILVEAASDINWNLIKEDQIIGLTAGASAPEILINSVIKGFQNKFKTIIEDITITEENLTFNLPKSLAF